MKRFFITILTLIVCLSSLTACNKNQESASLNKLVVYSSFYAMYDLTSKIGKDNIELHNMVAAGVEPHDFEPTANDIINLEKADVFVYNGSNMEHWVDKVIDSIESPKLITVQASNGVELISDEQQSDPHVWLSPKNAKIEAANIKDALIQADSKNSLHYQENYNQLCRELDNLDKEFSSTLNPLPKKDIVVAHRAYSYLCKEYGLNQIAINGISPDSEPDPLSMAKTIEYCKTHNINTIFFEEMVSPKIAQVIADELSAKVAVLNPLEGLSSEEVAAGDDYFTIMRKNLAALEGALS